MFLKGITSNLVSCDWVKLIFMWIVTELLCHIIYHWRIANLIIVLQINACVLPIKTPLHSPIPTLFFSLPLTVPVWKHKVYLIVGRGIFKGARRRRRRIRRKICFWWFFALLNSRRIETNLGWMMELGGSELWL